APRTIRSPRAAAARAPCQKASATSGASGCMKWTEAPFATASTRISLSAARTCGESCNDAILISDIRRRSYPPPLLKSLLGRPVDRPQDAERVLELAVAVAPEHVG